jgi:uncharacterized protein (TIGR02145 family)
MKKLVTFVSAIILSASLWAQAPQTFSYQAVVRGVNNELVANKPVGMKISLLQSSENGSAVFIETHKPTANENGLVSIAIGGGTEVNGTFANIDWSKGPYFIKTETDPAGGTNYGLSTISQLLSVPYALYAANSQPGPKGDKGDTGKDGVDGKDGAQGPQGLKGDKGEVGLSGKDGVDGKDGAQGLQGIKGDKGEVGLSGKDGFDGKDGAQGLQGIKGDKGEVGLAGKDGFDGKDGAQGLQGLKGDKGEVGLSGKDGAQGLQGIKGDKGEVGLAGKDGVDGKDGVQGTAGANGQGGVTVGGNNVEIIGSGTIQSPYIVNAKDQQNLYVSVTGDTLYLQNGGFVIIPGLSLANTKTKPTSGYGPNISDLDGNTYKTVYIGNQQWMAENLKTTVYANGEKIPNVVDNAQWNSLSTGAWAHYNNDKQYENSYGKLYNWYTVAGPLNVCPTGWHIPSAAEWSTLIKYIDPNADSAKNTNIAGGKMKTNGTQYWNTPNADATNESNFSGLPGGARYANGGFNYIGIEGYWWSSTVTNVAWYQGLNYNGNTTFGGYNDKWGGFSVRCLKD